MTINLPDIPIAKSVWPKIFGVIGLFAQGLSMAYYANPTYFIWGLSATFFWGSISTACNSAALFVCRQDNQSSEQVGAGNVPPKSATETKPNA